MALAGHLLADRPSQPASPSVITSGVRLSDTRVAIRSPGARPSGESGPDSSTTPVSMPPEPVTGFCILPRSADDAEHLRRMAGAPPPVGLAQLAEGCGVEVQPLHAHPHLVRPQAGAGVQPPGRLREHARRVQHPVQSER